MAIKFWCVVMTKAPHKILSIVVTFNGLTNNWIKKCLSSLEASTYSTDIMVIDNGSTDQTVNVIKQEFPKVSITANGKNLGFGQANNIGLKKCLATNHYQYAFLLNQDAWVAQNTLADLVSLSEKNSDYGIISPMHLNGQGNALDANFAYYIPAQKGNNCYPDGFLNTSKEIYPLPFVNAAAWLITKQCLTTVGGFSPTFYHYGEDDNYCHRVTWHKLKIGVAPKCTIFHDRENRPITQNNKQTWTAITRGFHLRYANPLVKVTLLRAWLALAKFALKKPLFFKDFLAFTFSTAWRKTIDNKNKQQLTAAFLNGA
jgi:GT2 family glycosyltransferase